MQPEMQVLPIRIRPMRFETPVSYEERLFAANKVRVIRYKHLPRWRAEPEVMEAELERLGELRPGHFAAERARLPRHSDGSSCQKCTTGIENRFACTRCSGGAVAKQHPHDAPRVCRRHKRWVGPAANSDEQWQVDADVIRADNTYAVLKRRGIIDANRLAELEDFVERWATGEKGLSLSASERFTLAVDVAHKVLAPHKVRHIMLLPSPNDQYEALHQATCDAVGGTATSLVDRLWSLLRPLPESVTAGTHDFGLNPTAPGFVDASEHYEQARTCVVTRQAHLHETRYAGSANQNGRTRYAGHLRVSYVCRRGHEFTGPPSKFKWSGDADGCPVCNKRVVVAGVNSLADTHPELAAQWHPDANDALRPEEVAGGSATKVFWLCSDGHTFRSTLNQRTTAGAGCGYCVNQLVSAELNSLTLTHPGVAAEWHPTLNAPLTPEDVVAGSGRRVWWQCARGHALHRTVAHRVKAAECSVCNGRNLTPESNLAATHPEVAKLWHPMRNGELRPDAVRPMAATPVWWLCTRGHEYKSKIRTQSQGSGCLVCSSQVLAPERSMRVMRPDLVASFHPTKNGAVTPDNVSGVTHRKLHWRCTRGHEWYGHISRRPGIVACPYCRGRKPLPGVDDLETVDSRAAAEWHPSRNGNRCPSGVRAASEQRAWWQCPSGHEWSSSVAARTRRGASCPECG